jgi:hypothetical protein
LLARREQAASQEGDLFGHEPRVRRFLDRLAIYCGLKGDGSRDPPPERPTLLTGTIAWGARV